MDRTGGLHDANDRTRWHGSGLQRLYPKTNNVRLYVDLNIWKVFFFISPHLLDSLSHNSLTFSLSPSLPFTTLPFFVRSFRSNITHGICLHLFWQYSETDDDMLLNQGDLRTVLRITNLDLLDCIIYNNILVWVYLIARISFSPTWLLKFFCSLVLRLLFVLLTDLVTSVTVPGNKV